LGHVTASESQKWQTLQRWWAVETMEAFK
jgi:hypothetical protein